LKTNVDDSNQLGRSSQPLHRVNGQTAVLIKYELHFYFSQPDKLKGKRGLFAIDNVHVKSIIDDKVVSEQDLVFDVVNTHNRGR
jgi:hypothetical protein